MEDEMYWELEFLCTLFFWFIYDSLYNYFSYLILWGLVLLNKYYMSTFISRKTSL